MQKIESVGGDRDSLSVGKIVHGKIIRLRTPQGVEVEGQVVKSVGRWDETCVFVRSWQAEFPLHDLLATGWRILS